MNTERDARLFLASVLLALSVLLAAPVGALAARVDVRKMLDTSTLGDPFMYDVAPGGAVLVLTKDNIYDAGTGEFLFGEPLANPGGLSLAGGKLRFLVDGALYIVDGGMPRKLLDVPLKNAVFVPDGERTFIGGITTAGRPVLFIYKEGVGHKPLLELNVPIDAMTLARGELFFAVGPKIYALKEGEPARLFASLPGFSHIPSIAMDEKRGVLYFSDGDNIYAVHGRDFVVVRRGLGGTLRCRDGNLYVLSRRERALYRMSGLSEAILAADTLAPLQDPCKDPVLSLYCGAEEKRAVLKSLAKHADSIAAGDAVARNDLVARMAGQRNELERIMAGIEKEAATGAEGVLWGGGLDPRTIGSNVPIATEGKGMGLTLWDGSEFRVGPATKAIVGDCRPSRECGQSLEKGLLYFEAYKPPAEGMAGPTHRGYVLSTKALSLRFGAARFAAFADGDRTAVVVLEGRVTAVTPRGESVTVAAGEMLEASRDERPGAPGQAELERLNKWWEEIR